MPFRSRSQSRVNSKAPCARARAMRRIVAIEALRERALSHVCLFEFHLRFTVTAKGSASKVNFSCVTRVLLVETRALEDQSLLDDR